MKIYYITYVTPERGTLEAFGSKKAAEKRIAEINKEQHDARKEYVAKEVHEYGDIMPYDQLPDRIGEIELPITKQGVLSALELGADIVPQ
jgi:hypothetical protein